MADSITIPAFPNKFPYNELLLDGKLQIKGELHAKSRTWRWKHRGLTLLYTSSRADQQVVRAYDLDPRGFAKGVIVGCGKLVDVRDLTDGERVTLFKGFNNIKSKSVARRVMHTGGNHIWPLPIGFFFEDLQRFDEPIAFKPPQGAVRTFRVPLDLVEDQLKMLGYDIRQIRNNLAA